ncbi:hypothetical protein KIPB_009156 [Kipferlia bialata]|uniref:Uncharacterized protein n=1 Tax=Kipferlia bialata TaxID=797122 RepID=A0A9K3D172_9EUKA|nr:hypothetical protein KIPB_009156 [Kipferlia bialata]|eukprot:g9156.t1
MSADDARAQLVERIKSLEAVVKRQSTVLGFSKNRRSLADALKRTDDAEAEAEQLRSTVQELGSALNEQNRERERERARMQEKLDAADALVAQIQTQTHTTESTAVSGETRATEPVSPTPVSAGPSDIDTVGKDVSDTCLPDTGVCTDVPDVDIALDVVASGAVRDALSSPLALLDRLTQAHAALMQRQQEAQHEAQHETQQETQQEVPDSTGTDMESGDTEGSAPVPAESGTEAGEEEGEGGEVESGDGESGAVDEAGEEGEAEPPTQSPTDREGETSVPDASAGGVYHEADTDATGLLALGSLLSALTTSLDPLYIAQQVGTHVAQAQVPIRAAFAQAQAAVSGVSAEMHRVSAMRESEREKEREREREAVEVHASEIQALQAEISKVKEESAETERQCRETCLAGALEGAKREREREQREASLVEAHQEREASLAAQLAECQQRQGEREREAAESGSASQAELSSLQAQLAKAAEESEALAVKVKEAEARAEGAAASTQRKRDRLHTAKEELATLRGQATQAQTQLREAAEREAGLRDQVRDLTKEVQGKTRQLVQATNQLETQTPMLESFKAKAAGLSGEVSEAKSEVAQLKKQLKEHKAQLHRLGQALDKAQREVATLQSKLGTANDTIGGTRQQVQALQHKAAQAKAERAADMAAMQVGQGVIGDINGIDV